MSEKFMGLLPTPRAQEPGRTNEGYGASLNDLIRGTRPDVFEKPAPTVSPQLTLFAEDSPASRSVLPGSEGARKMSVTSGLSICELLSNSTPLGSLVKMFLASSIWNSTRCYLTWKTRVTKQQRLLFQLAVSMPRTGGTGCSLWHTPTRADTHPSYEKRYPGGKERPSPIPNLAAEVNEGMPYIERRMWPTPATVDYKGARRPETIEATGHNPMTNSLRDCVEVTDPAEPGQLCGSLNPTWVEWLMGFPGGWTDLNASETP